MNQKDQEKTQYIPCTVGILTFNSADTLQRCLESIRDFAEIIICDGGSTDDTRTIAKRYNCRVIDQNDVFKNEENKLINYAGARNQCLDAASYDWFFYIDSDEHVAQDLVEEIRDVVSSSNADILVYNITPRIIVEGIVIEHSSNYPGWQKRLFHIDSGARFIKPVHERIKIPKNVEEGYLLGHWYYYSPPGRKLGKLNKYARMEARMLYGKSILHFLRKGILGRVEIVIKIILKTLWYHIKYRKGNKMPLAIELRRIKYQWAVIWYTFELYWRAN